MVKGGLPRGNFNVLTSRRRATLVHTGHKRVQPPLERFFDAGSHSSNSLLNRGDWICKRGDTTCAQESVDCVTRTNSSCDASRRAGITERNAATQDRAEKEGHLVQDPFTEREQQQNPFEPFIEATPTKVRLSCGIEACIKKKRNKDILGWSDDDEIGPRSLRAKERKINQHEGEKVEDLPSATGPKDQPKREAASKRKREKEEQQGSGNNHQKPKSFFLGRFNGSKGVLANTTSSEKDEGNGRWTLADTHAKENKEDPGVVVPNSDEEDEEDNEPKLVVNRWRKSGPPICPSPAGEDQRRSSTAGHIPGTASPPFGCKSPTGSVPHSASICHNLPSSKKGVGDTTPWINKARPGCVPAGATPSASVITSQASPGAKCTRLATTTAKTRATPGVDFTPGEPLSSSLQAPYKGCTVIDPSEAYVANLPPAGRASFAIPPQSVGSCGITHGVKCEAPSSTSGNVTSEVTPPTSTDRLRTPGHADANASFSAIQQPHQSSLIDTTRANASSLEGRDGAPADFSESPPEDFELPSFSLGLDSFEPPSFSFGLDAPNVPSDDQTFLRANHGSSSTPPDPGIKCTGPSSRAAGDASAFASAVADAGTSADTLGTPMVGTALSQLTPASDSPWLRRRPGKAQEGASHVEMSTSRNDRGQKGRVFVGEDTTPVQRSSSHLPSLTEQRENGRLDTDGAYIMNMTAEVSPGDRRGSALEARSSRDTFVGRQQQPISCSSSPLGMPPSATGLAGIRDIADISSERGRLTQLQRVWEEGGVSKHQPGSSREASKSYDSSSGLRPDGRPEEFDQNGEGQRRRFGLHDVSARKDSSSDLNMPLGDSSDFPGFSLGLRKQPNGAAGSLRAENHLNKEQNVEGTPARQTGRAAEILTGKSARPKMTPLYQSREFEGDDVVQPYTNSTSMFVGSDLEGHGVSSGETDDEDQELLRFNINGKPSTPGKPAATGHSKFGPDVPTMAHPSHAKSVLEMNTLYTLSGKPETHRQAQGESGRWGASPGVEVRAGAVDLGEGHQELSGSGQGAVPATQGAGEDARCPKATPRGRVPDDSDGGQAGASTGQGVGNESRAGAGAGKAAVLVDLEEEEDEEELLLVEKPCRREKKLKRLRRKSEIGRAEGGDGGLDEPEQGCRSGAAAAAARATLQRAPPAKSAPPLFDRQDPTGVPTQQGASEKEEGNAWPETNPDNAGGVEDIEVFSSQEDLAETAKLWPPLKKATPSRPHLRNILTGNPSAYTKGGKESRSTGSKGKCAQRSVASRIVDSESDTEEDEEATDLGSRFRDVRTSHAEAASKSEPSTGEEREENDKGEDDWREWGGMREEEELLFRKRNGGEWDEAEDPTRNAEGIGGWREVSRTSSIGGRQRGGGGFEGPGEDWASRRFDASGEGDDVNHWARGMAHSAVDNLEQRERRTGPLQDERLGGNGAQPNLWDGAEWEWGFANQGSDEDQRMAALLRERLPHFWSVSQLEREGSSHGEPVYIDYRNQFGTEPSPGRQRAGSHLSAGAMPGSQRRTRKSQSKGGVGAAGRQNAAAGTGGRWSFEGGQKVYINKAGKKYFGRIAYLESLRENPNTAKSNKEKKKKRNNKRQRKRT